MEKEFEILKREHNKVAHWIEFFNHKLKEKEDEILILRKELEKTKEKEELLGRSILKIMEDNKK